MKDGSHSTCLIHEIAFSKHEQLMRSSPLTTQSETALVQCCHGLAPIARDIPVRVKAVTAVNVSSIVEAAAYGVALQQALDEDTVTVTVQRTRPLEDLVHAISELLGEHCRPTPHLGQ